MLIFKTTNSWLKQYDLKQKWAGMFFILLVCFALANTGLYYLQLNSPEMSSSFIWLSFYFWLASLAPALFLGWSWIDKNSKSQLKQIVKQDWKQIGCVMLLAGLLRFAFLNSLGYVLVGDPLREIGSNALPILAGDDFDPFTLGSYHGYGNFLPWIGSWFIRVFETTPLAIRLPAAILGLLSVIFVYLLVRFWKDRTTAIMAALFLAVSMRHLHYSRSEIVIVSPALFIAVMLLGALIIQKTQAGWFLLGIIVGFSFHFYVATRPIALVIMLYLFLTQMRKFQFKSIIYAALKFACGVLVGLGPAILYLNSQATGAGSWVFQQNEFIELNLIGRIQYLFDQYLGAMGNNFFTQTSAIHYPLITPIIELPLNLLTIASIPLMFIKKFRGYLSSLLLILLFSLPFFLQVLSFDIGQDQRNLANVVVGAVLSAVFLKWFLNRKQLRKIPLIITLLLIALNIFNTTKAYFYEKATYSAHINDQDEFSFQAVNDHINLNKYYYQEKEVNLVVVYEQSQLSHVHNKVDYFAFPLSIELMHPDEYQLHEIKDNSVYYFVDDYQLELNNAIEYRIQCPQSIWPQYYCPLDVENGYSFFVMGV